MPDRQLEYFYDWEILGPDGLKLISLKRSPPPLEKDRLDDIDYLCDRIRKYPDSTLMDNDFWYKIVMLRQKAYKNPKFKEQLSEIFKAILGHGNLRKNEVKLEKVKINILRDINFFHQILDVTKGSNIAVDQAIYDFLEGAENNIEEYDTRINQADNYETIYYAYRKVYNVLCTTLTDIEIFSFFEEAAKSIHVTNVTIDISPDNRLLSFVKKHTWYVKGNDMETKFE